MDTYIVRLVLGRNNTLDIHNGNQFDCAVVIKEIFELNKSKKLRVNIVEVNLITGSKIISTHVRR